MCLCVYLYVCLFTITILRRGPAFRTPESDNMCVFVCVCLLIITICPGPAFREHRRDNIHIQTVSAHGQGEWDKVTRESDRGQGDD